MDPILDFWKLKKIYMLISSAQLAISQLFSPGFRSVLWKSLGWTIALLVALWFGLSFAVENWVVSQLTDGSWIETIASWLLSAGIVLATMFLIAPVTAIFAGLFLDEIAQEVERVHYPDDQSGQSLPLNKSIFIGLKFTSLVIIGNLLALVFLLVPGVNLVIFYLLNGFLLGREYFQFASLRYYSENESIALRKSSPFKVFLAGLFIAFTLTIPIINLLSPLFAAAMMVHLVKAMGARRIN